MGTFWFPHSSLGMNYCITQARSRCMVSLDLSFYICTPPLPRALSEAQEKAQLLTGHGMPEAVLKSLLSGSTVGEKVFVVNLTPYEACLEKVCLQFSHKNPGYQVRAMSLSTDVAVASYCEKLVALFLLEDLGVSWCFSCSLVLCFK